MNAVARELNCTAPALQGRFGSKSGLLQSFLRWGTALVTERFRRVRRDHASPIVALRERFRYPDIDRLQDDYEIGNSINQINLIGFHVAAWSDPALHDLEKERRQLFEDEIVALLTEAVENGEIKGCDPRRLGRLILAATVGTELQWVSDPDPVIGDRLVEVIDDLVRPYCVQSHQP
jgi:AcrR family transcriptional regulator